MITGHKKVITVVECDEHKGFIHAWW